MAVIQVPVRWQKDESRIGRTFPEAGPQLADDECPGCGEPLGSGSVTLLVVGPGKDPEDREKHWAGRWYSAWATVAHTACLGVEVDQ